MSLEYCLLACLLTPLERARREHRPRSAWTDDPGTTLIVSGSMSLIFVQAAAQRIEASFTRKSLRVQLRPSISPTPFACGSRSLLRELSRATAAGPMRGCSINAEQVLLECSRCALLMPTLARKSANPGHMSPKFLRCAGCMDCASRRGRIFREGGARKQRLLASEKSRPATRSSAALVRLGDAQEAPSNRRLRAAWLARVRPRWQLTSGRGSSHTLNSWPRARLSPLPYTIAAAAAKAALVAAATAAAVTAGRPLLLPGRRPIFATKLP